MTPKQILDSFSETLMRDERILSAQERALVANLLHHAKTAAGANPETNEAVKAVIAAAIGETVAQRAFSVLGGSIVERDIRECVRASLDQVKSDDLFQRLGHRLFADAQQMAHHLVPQRRCRRRHHV